MALDTREKRASAINWFTPLPLPDGAVGADDREQVSWVYVGIEAAPATDLRYHISGREPARQFAGRRAPNSVSGRRPATTASGTIRGHTP